MKTLSLKLDEPVFLETEVIVHKLKKSRNRYINEALKFYNHLHNRRILGKQLRKDSLLVREESMKVLKEFESLNDED